MRRCKSTNNRSALSPKIGGIDMVNSKAWEWKNK